jgi:uncharacterized membrane protein YeaQ/YmgE (transglycosylase-associated protein family)
VYGAVLTAGHLPAPSPAEVLETLSYPSPLSEVSKQVPRGAPGDGTLGAMDILEWIVLGFLAGALSGAVVGGRTARGCLPNVVVGILGAIVGGWIARQLGFGQVQGFVAAVVVAIFGAVVIRVILEALSPRDGR